MRQGKFEVAIIGGGAAGIAAAKHLKDAGRSYILLEAQSRLGGRAYTFNADGFPIDLGCGWLHSADKNPWVRIARDAGLDIDKTRPPWERPAYANGFPAEDQQAFQAELGAFYDRADKASLADKDYPLSHFLKADSRWNPLINAISTYFSGAELEFVSAQDLQDYQDSEVNWRVAGGYGALISGYGRGLNAILNCRVDKIDWSSAPVRISGPAGTLECDAAIVTLPTAAIAAQPELFAPVLPEKVDAAENLPLGLADKLHLSLENAEEFGADTRLFGRTDRTATAIYHMRPFGRPIIECYFGGECAAGLERGGAAAFFDFAAAELTSLFGSAFARRVTPLPMHLWHADAFARGSYSYAKPGHAKDRAVLAAPVADRLFFAGEACSTGYFSTAHGAFESGVRAAQEVLARVKQS